MLIKLEDRYISFYVLLIIRWTGIPPRTIDFIVGILEGFARLIGSREELSVIALS